ncbi:hypothetical protein L2E82_46417 [Cichorium intybus]|uniref:Uncharacterized protein n=1 Tax=Cichorium intybus TaxID=13427 RepID=A0ACB8YTH7_CICIN|nr:hypothetical protein L2E82_46417 [Cichorium intybus]
MKKGYLKTTKKRKGQDEDIHVVKRSGKSGKIKKGSKMFDLIYLYYTHFTVKPFPRGLPAISSWDIMILRQREIFEEKSGGFGRCMIIDDAIVERELQEERKNELPSLILKGLEDEPQDNNLLSLLIEFDYEFGAQRRHDDEEVETPIQSPRKYDVMKSPVPFDLSPTLLDEVIKSCKNIEAKKEMENKKKSLMPSIDFQISQDEFSFLSDESLQDLINNNYPLFKRGIEEDMKHDVEIQDFQKVDLVFFPIHGSGHYYLIGFDLRKHTFIFIDNIKRRNNSTNHYHMFPINLKYLFIRYLESVGQKMADVLRKCKLIDLDFEWKTKENVQNR